MTQVPEFGSVAEAAELFGVGEHAVRTAVRNGDIPHVKLGRIIRIPLKLIAETLETQVLAGSTEVGRE